ncbi:STM4014 family protein [Halovulum sp. GXIMD14793]
MERRAASLCRRIGVTAGRIIVLGAGAGRRFEAFEAAVRRAGVSDVVPVIYGQRPTLRAGDWLRFDSPDESAAAMQAVYDAGAGRAAEQGFPLPDSVLGSSAQLAFGLQALQRDAMQPGICVTASPDEIALCYDKTACAAHLKTRGIPVPQVFAAPACFDELMALLRVEKRLFLKQRYGAGATGTIALMAGPRGQVIGHTAMILNDADPRYGKRVQKVDDHTTLRKMFDLLQPLGLHVERWIPKAGLDGRSCDLRIVAIRNAPPFAVLRLSRSPITNLHLDAMRAEAEALFSLMDAAQVEAIWETVRKVQAAFPGSLSVAPDIAVRADLRSHVVLEVNAFGDHIRRMTIDGRTPQDWQVRQMLAEMSHAA